MGNYKEFQKIVEYCEHEYPEIEVGRTAAGAIDYFTCPYCGAKMTLEFDLITTKNWEMCPKCGMYWRNEW